MKEKFALKTFSDIEKEGLNFYVDLYQRGYRWTKNEVRDLLDDIKEFTLNEAENKNTFYCLQPVIIKKNIDGNLWNIIDGQQRLSTIYLIYFYFEVAYGNLRENIPFKLKYNNKTQLEECLEQILRNKLEDSNLIETTLSKYKNDIDCYYIIEAYKEICDYFNDMRKDSKKKFIIIKMMDTFDNRTKIIWYQIENLDLKTEVLVFSKINMGKIPLTNAELIKALLLKKDKNDNEKIKSIRTNISLKWDEIESHLSNEDFWDFLVNENENNYYTTRIDFIFRIMAHSINEEILRAADKKYPQDEAYFVNENSNKEKFSFYVFSNYEKLLKLHEEENSEKDVFYIEKIWDDVSEYYRMFKDWYLNLDWYHMIGFLVTTSKQNYIKQILELTELYQKGSSENGEGHKSSFEKGLRQKIINKLFDNGQIKRKECKDLISSLSYEDNKEDIKNILLLYNLAFLKKCNKNGRFPFDKYKDAEIKWDIEHINATADSRPDDDIHDTESNNRRIWLKAARNIPGIEKIAYRNSAITEAIDNLLKNKHYLTKEQTSTQDFIEIYDTIINEYGGTSEPDNTIGNLTLLDCGTNRSYKNDVFPLKRKKILERSLEDYFIPLCTRRVFAKAFVDSTDLLRWKQEDKEIYVDDLVNTVCDYLLIKD